MAITAVKSMPAIFVGHGNPMNIIRRNRWTEGWRSLGAAIPKPRAILAVSAHWYLPRLVLGTSMISFVKGKTEISLNLPDW
jgi:aromatic ring-opening dioxygenase catalytic subunit (LigB family)